MFTSCGGASLFVGGSVNVAVFRAQLHLCVSRQFLWLGEGFASGSSHCERRSGVLENADLV